MPPTTEFPRARDFFLRVNLDSASLSNVSCNDGTGTSLDIETVDGELPTFESGKTTILYFTETLPGTFLLKSQQVEAAT